MYSFLLQVSFVAFGIAILLSPLAGKIAAQLRIIDAPDSERKFHRSSIPLAGGIVVFASLLSAGMFSAFVGAVQVLDVVPVVLAMTTITAVGLLDDRFTLNSRQKLVGQCLSLVFLIGGGFEFFGISLLGMPLDLGILEIPIVAILLLSAINGFNFLDGADGFAASIGLVTSLALCGIAVCSGLLLEAVLAASLAGALLGFLTYNFPPARMFLGDSGSMLVGLVIGCLVFRIGASLAAPTPIGVAAALLALPCLDMSAAIVRRKLTGRVVSAADRAHLHHCLSRNGFGPRRIVLAATVFCAIPAFGAFIAVVTEYYFASWISLFLLVIVMLRSRSFGGNELKLILEHLLGRGSHLSRLDEANLRERQVRIGLRQSEECQSFWQALTEFAAAHDLSRVTLHLSGSWMDDGLDVFWESTLTNRTMENWRSTLPIYADGRRFGHVEISGAVTGSCGQHILGPLGNLVDANVPYIDRLFRDVAKRTVARQMGEKNRVLFVHRFECDDGDTAGPPHTDLYEELGAHFDVSVLVGQSNQTGAAQSTSSNDVDFYHFSYTKSGERTNLGRTLNRLRFTTIALWKMFWIPKHDVVVVETDSVMLTLVSVIVKRYRGSKLIIRMQEFHPDSVTATGKVRRRFIGSLTASLMQRACVYADKIVVLGDDTMRGVVACGIDESRVTLIPNWIATRKYLAQASNEFREVLKDKFVVLNSAAPGSPHESDEIFEVAGQPINHASQRFAEVLDEFVERRSKPSSTNKQSSSKPIERTPHSSHLSTRSGSILSNIQDDNQGVAQHAEVTEAFF